MYLPDEFGNAMRSQVQSSLTGQFTNPDTQNRVVIDQHMLKGTSIYPKTFQQIGDSSIAGEAGILAGRCGYCSAC
jgi:hypothetical protein